MKIWIKILIGSILGVLLGIFLPGTEKAMELFSFVNRLFIQIGRYVVFPLVFFALVAGTNGEAARALREFEAARETESGLPNKPD